MIPYYEINTPLFRDIQPDETVIIEPMRWLMEAYIHGVQRDKYWAKCDTLAITWILAQPDCQLINTRCMAVRQPTTSFYRYILNFPAEQFPLYNVPNRLQLPFFDTTHRRQNMDKVPPIHKPEFCPKPVTLNPAEFTEDTPESVKKAYDLCLPERYMIYSEEISP